MPSSRAPAPVHPVDHPCAPPRAGVWILALGLIFLSEPVLARDASQELKQPPVCSVQAEIPPALKGICTVKQHEVEVSLTAERSPIHVGGYKVTTENYNGNYLTPVVEAMPGDTVSARLMNSLPPRKHDPPPHGDGDTNPTNLHYFHGGIVSPNNAWPNPAELGNGDNIYVHLKAGRSAQVEPNNFRFQVAIPGEGMLDARVLETDGYISHPLGLNWYHSHLHGISSDQVMGGMSGLLSVGNAKANVKAACRQSPNANAKCHDVAKETAALKRRTDVRYVVLRDLPLKTNTIPAEADDAPADWDPAARNFPKGQQCGVLKTDGTFDFENVKLRTGYCQRDKEHVWLFTLNGQRFPTITVEGGRNVLIRLGNLSANIPYWLELCRESDDKCVQLQAIGLDGVVPAKPALPEQINSPVKAIEVPNLLMMPATRAEIYIRNDTEPHKDTGVYILRTRGLDTGRVPGRDPGSDPLSDVWPAIQLARVVLKPNVNAGAVILGLARLSSAEAGITTAIAGLAPEAAEAQPHSEGCIRDLNPDLREYRRVTFLNGDETDWSITTEMIRPPAGQGLLPEDQLQAADDNETVSGPFEQYELDDGTIDWKKRHVCILIDHDIHKGSHKQLWVLSNGTNTLHNFHIHQMKFRLATQDELAQHGIERPKESHTCDSGPGQCAQPDYKLYDDRQSPAHDADDITEWHDTIPIPPSKRVFLTMSFDAKQQIGRFVFHCHILKHEDRGLMAPIEVWEPR